MRQHSYAGSLLIVAMAATATGAGQVIAQGIGVELRQPEAGLELLKRRMQDLDSGPMPDRTQGPPLQVDGGLRSVWSALRVGMSEADVNMLLGTPDRIEGGGAEPSRWIWDKPGARGGWVAFDPGARTVREWRTF